MSIKFYKNETEDITNVNTKLYKKYVSGYLPSDDIVEMYKLEYVKEPDESSITVIFPPKESNDNFGIVFLDSANNEINNKSITFGEDTDFIFYVKITSDSVGGLNNSIGLNSYNRDIKVISNVTPVTGEYQYITRLYFINPNGIRNEQNSLRFENVIPADINEETITDLYAPISVDSGLNIYNYDNQNNIFGPMVPKSDEYEYFIRIQNINDIELKLYVDSLEVTPFREFISGNLIFGPIPYTKDFKLVGEVDVLSNGAYAEIVHYTIIDGVSSQPQTVTLTVPKGERPVNTTTTTTTKPCATENQSCAGTYTEGDVMICNGLGPDGNCCAGFYCDIFEDVCKECL